MEALRASVAQRTGEKAPTRKPPRKVAAQAAGSGAAAEPARKTPPAEPALRARAGRR
jgi:hypothetical protein